MKDTIRKILKEQQLERLVSNYLDSQDWRVWDFDDGEFDVSDGDKGKNIFKFRLQFSSMDPEHSFDILYINESILHQVNNLFSMDSMDSRKLIIDWFNKKFDKNITLEDVEWFGWGDDEDGGYLDEEIIIEQYDGNRLYPKDEIMRLLKGAPKELRLAAKKLPSIECENDKGERTICTKIPQTIFVYLTGRY